jgi:hypothetical protein
MTDPVLGDPQAASGGRRKIPLVPSLIYADPLEQALWGDYDTGWWGTLRIAKIDLGAGSDRVELALDPVTGSINP